MDKAFIKCGATNFRNVYLSKWAEGCSKGEKVREKHSDLEGPEHGKKSMERCVG